MAKLKKWHIALIVIGSILVLLGAAALTVYFVIYYGQENETLVYENLDGFERSEWIIGTDTYKSAKSTTKVRTMDIPKLLGKTAQAGASYSSSNKDVASVNGSKITIVKEGEFTLTMTVGDKKTNFDAKVVKGVNVFTFEDCYNAIQLQDVPVQQADITAFKATAPGNKTKFAKTPKVDNLLIHTSYYGNGYKFFAGEVNQTYGSTFFAVQAKDVVFQDLYLRGKEPPTEDVLVDLSYYEEGGTLISFDSTTEMVVSGGLKHCILENGHKILLINAADVTVEGSIIRNGSDTCISVQTNNDGPCTITLKNNVLANGAVGGVVMWLMEQAAIKPENYVTVNIEGFLDIVNWKDTSKIQLLPNAEGALADLLNPLIRQTMEEKTYESYFYKYKDKSYLSPAIIAISTGGSKNVPKINGFENVGFEQRDFPLPSYVQKLNILKTCLCFGYNQNPPIQPGEGILSNEKIFNELINGRK